VALAMYQDTLTRRTATLGPDHIDTIRSTHNLANGYYSLHQMPEAMKLFEEALAKATRVLGEEHFITIASRGSLAACYTDSGHAEKAIPLMEQVYARELAMFGAEHPSTRLTRSNLATGYLKTKNYAKAKPLAQQNLNLSIAKYGPDHKETLKDQLQLGVICGQSSDFVQALPLLKQSLTQFPKYLEIEHPYHILCLEMIVECHMGLQQYAEAIGPLKSLLQLAQAAQGPDREEILITKFNLGKCFVETGSPNEAIRLLEECHRAKQEYPALQACDVELCNAYIAVGRRAEATKIITAMLREQRRAKPPNSVELAALLRNYATGYQEIQRTTEAESLFREALAIYEQRKPAEWVVWQCRSELGECLRMQKRYSEAEPLLVASYTGLREHADAIPATESNVVCRAGQRLAELYDATNRRELAAAVRQSSPKEQPPKPRSSAQ
jgi:eukaryotic-like serine/threonine-protein kinase